ncbi:MAG: hypothetical protein J5758_03620 [Abditibacteriota bacterium]|nr:hypothetical protein [Abditibacteriota bacterium]
MTHLSFLTAADAAALRQDHSAKWLILRCEDCKGKPASVRFDMDELANIILAEQEEVETALSYYGVFRNRVSFDAEAVKRDIAANFRNYRVFMTNWCGVYAIGRIEAVSERYVWVTAELWLEETSCVPFDTGLISGASAARILDSRKIFEGAHVYAELTPERLNDLAVFRPEKLEPCWLRFEGTVSSTENETLTLTVPFDLRTKWIVKCALEPGARVGDRAAAEGRLMLLKTSRTAISTGSEDNTVTFYLADSPAPRHQHISGETVKSLRSEQCGRQFAVYSPAPLGEVCIPLQVKIGRCCQENGELGLVAQQLVGSRVFMVCKGGAGRKYPLYAVGHIEAASDRYMWAIPDFYIDSMPDVGDLLPKRATHKEKRLLPYRRESAVLREYGFAEISGAAAGRILDRLSLDPGKKAVSTVRENGRHAACDLLFDIADIPGCPPERLVSVRGYAAGFGERTKWGKGSALTGQATLTLDAFWRGSGTRLCCDLDPFDTDLLDLARELRPGDPAEVRGELRQISVGHDGLRTLKLKLHGLGTDKGQAEGDAAAKGRRI